MKTLINKQKKTKELKNMLIGKKAIKTGETFFPVCLLRNNLFNTIGTSRLGSNVWVVFTWLSAITSCLGST